MSMPSKPQFIPSDLRIESHFSATAIDVVDWSNRLIDNIVAHPVDGQNLLRLNRPQLLADPTARITVAWVGNHVAGCIVTIVDGRGPSASVNSLAVDPEFRGLGLAKLLVRTATDDRLRIDGYGYALFADVRVLPGGFPNMGSYRALVKNGFVATCIKRIAFADLGWRGSHLATSLEADGTIRAVVLVKIPAISHPALGIEAVL
jgi:GNAT superfamily N-acetyltransferase